MYPQDTSDEGVAAWAKQKQDFEAAQQHQERVDRWRMNMSMILMSMSASGPDIKRAAVMADELCAEEDKRFGPRPTLAIANITPFKPEGT